jgi:hypothetical protein
MKTKFTRYIVYIIAFCSILYARQVFSQFPVLNLPPDPNSAGVYPDSTGLYLQGNYTSSNKIIMTPPFHTSAADYPGQAFNASIDNSAEQITPGGIFDYVYDQFGKKYKLSDISIEKATKMGPNNQPKTTLGCMAGYFNLYFEQNWERNTADESIKRALLCQLFTDMSNFINSPLWTTGERVNIWIRDITHVINNSATSPAAALATVFFVVPTGASNISGIADNEVWKTINSGVDSYSGVTSPLSYQVSSQGTYFHGQLAFNFEGFPSNWNYNSAANTNSSNFDLYSIALHELVHSLGFGTLINETGQSVFAPWYNYYSRYDRFLFDPSYTPIRPLITNTGACQMYNYQFNPNVDVNHLISNTSSSYCSQQVLYSGTTTQLTYTPATYSQGTSLSHFEDLCYVPMPLVPYQDDEYYVMSNNFNPLVTLMKRYLKPEERQVLCDLGYSVNGIYNSTADDAYHNYLATTCPGLQVAGVNDGIQIGGPNNGAYIFTGIGGGPPVDLSNIWQNDYNADHFECLEPIIGGGFVTTSGSSTYYVFTTPGLKLLRYIPVAANGNRGNITYVFVYVHDQSCTPGPCSASDLINNGGFETAQDCGSMITGSTLHPTINCWEPFSDTPDVHVRNCSLPSWGVPTQWCTSPNNDTWNNGLGINNNNFIGLVSTGASGSIEAIQNNLSSPILPNTAYILSFWARIPNVFGADLPTTLEFWGSANLLASIGVMDNWSYDPLTGSTVGLTFLNSISVPNTAIPGSSHDGWNYFELPIQTANTAPNLNVLMIVNASYIDNPNPPFVTRYVLIDDMSLKPVGQQATFGNFSHTLCISQTIDDLNIYTNPTPPGGTFSGVGVSCFGNTCSFNVSAAGLGPETILYNYTNNLGCPMTEPIFLNVIHSNLNITVTPQNASCDGICDGAAWVTVNYNSPPSSYLWSDPLGQPTQTASNLCAGSYFVSVTDNYNCTVVGSALVNNAIPLNWPYHPDDGNGDEGGTSVDIDEYNNVYATGTFTDHITFGSYQFYNPIFPHNKEASYIVKLDECGEVLWAKMLFSDNAGITINKIVVVDEFSFIITGIFQGTVDFGNGFTATSNSEESPFVAKYTWNTGTVDYECQWFDYKGGSDIALDIDSYHFYVIGSLYNPLLHSYSILTAQYDIDGTIYWVSYDAGQPYTLTSGNAITYCTSCPAGNKLLSTGQKDGYVCLIVQDENNGGLMINTYVYPNFHGAGNSIVSNNDGTNWAYIAGYMDNGPKQILLLKINVANPASPYQVSTGGSSSGGLYDAATGIDINQAQPYNELFITGHFNSPSITFTGPTTITLNNANPTLYLANDFVVKYDAFYFTPISAIASIPTSTNDNSMAIKLNDNNSFGYITGGFTGSAQFVITNPIPLTAVYAQDVFIARIEDLPNNNIQFRKSVKGNEDTTSLNNISVYPNPANDALFIDLSFEEKTFVILSLYDIFGKQIEDGITGYLLNDKIRMDISRFATGLYMLRVETNNGINNYKIIKE